MTSKAALVLILLAGAPGSLLAQALTDEPADSKPLPAAAEDAEGTDPGPLTTSGVYFGHILALDVDAKAVFIKPADSGFSRRSFYFDRKTLFTAVDSGVRKKIRERDLIEGQKVAVRYFALDNLAVADEIFVVTGEFEPAVYQRRTKISPKSKEAETQAKHGGKNASASQEKEEKKGAH